MTPEEFRKLGHDVVDWIADYRARVGELPVMSGVAPGSIRALLPAAPPSAPEPFDCVLRDLENVILPGLSHWQHPDFFGYFRRTASSRRCWAISEHGSRRARPVVAIEPALTELEEVVTDWVRQMVGLAPHGAASSRIRLRPRRSWHCSVPASGPPGSRWRAAACRRRRHPGRLRVVAQPQLGREGGAAGRIRSRQYPRDRGRRLLRNAPRRTRARHRGRSRRWPRALRDRRHQRYHDDDGVRSARAHCRGRARARPLAARRCRDGWVGDDPARVP